MLTHALPPIRAARRVASLGLAAMAGLLAAASLMALLLAVARPASAAATAIDHPYPGSAPCNTSLQACINNVPEGDTIVIQVGARITSVTLSRPVSLTGVASNTVILQALPGQRVLTVSGAAISNSVVISGITFIGGSLAGNSCPASCGGALLLTANAQPRLVNVIIARGNAYRGGGLYASSGSSVRLAGSQVLSNTAANAGGGAYASSPVTLDASLFYNNRCSDVFCIGGGLRSSGALTQTATRFISNSAAFVGGGVFANDTAVLTGGLYQDNHCTQDDCFGAGLYVEDSLAFTGTRFVTNTAAGSGGGGAYVAGPVMGAGGLFQANHCLAAGCNGGGLYTGATLGLSGTQFAGNTSVAHGGGAYSGGTATLQAGLFQGNACADAACHGGGLYAGNHLTAASTQFLSNTAGSRGGGVHVVGVVTFDGGLFQNNWCAANCSGGGLFTHDTLEMTGTQFISNTAGQSGGGVWAGEAVVLHGGLFQSNQCSQSDCIGGGLRTESSLTLTGTQFFSNTAHETGGGAYATSARLNGGQFRNNRCTEASCSAGALRASGLLAVTGTHFISNTATGNGGATMSEVAWITSGLFQDNHCTNAGCDGGGLYTFDTLTLTGTQLISNTAQGNGGGAIGDPLLVSGGLVLNNRCLGDDCRGAGLYSDSTASFSGTHFISNTAQSVGGGAFAMEAVVANGGLFRGNQCVQEACIAGGLFGASGLALTGTQFIDNAALGSGGGAVGVGTVVINGGLFQGNWCSEAGCWGGGLSIEGSVALSGTRFMSNTADMFGGGALVDGVATIKGGLFQDNWCTAGACRGGGLSVIGELSVEASEFHRNAAGSGGGLSHNGGAGALTNTLFVDNTASASGAALYLVSSGSKTLRHITIAASSQVTAAAVHVGGGTVAITNTLIARHAVGIRQTGGSVFEDYNLFSDVDIELQGTIGIGGHSLADADAALADPAAGDFHITAASDALDAGVDVGVDFDFEGQERLLGARPDIGYDEAYLANLRVSKTDGQAQARPGDLLVYTILVSNTGPNLAGSVLVSDSLPASLTTASWTCSGTLGSFCPASGSGSINVPVTITVGGRVQFTLQATVAAGASGPVNNTVTLYPPASLQDPTPNDHSATDTTIIVAGNKLYLPLILAE